ncbi:MAG: hypothetical protein JRG74_00110 [Deltaproteobacteria bacterium]|nr:hypothetical protein [Deltaproteobacteria bacterium]MBW1833275.1 hypothetical protein [Deltaproteobacteria bacterium]MBW2164542.1 hypothetical protein [Deltaproteobacteria bacterium]
MKESKGFKMLNEGYLSCIGRLNKRLINFHKDILKNYLRPLGANPLGFLESYFGLRMFRSPGAEMLNLPEVEMTYLIQPLINTLSMEKGLNSEEKPSACPSVEGQVKGLLFETKRKAISGGSANLIKSFLPIYKHKYIPAFMESLFYKGFKFKQDRIHLDSNSETFSAVKTAKSEIFTTRKEIFFGSGKFDLTTPKRLALLDHMPFPALQESKVADTVTPQPFPVATDIFFSLLKPQSRKPMFFSDNTVINGDREAQPILHLGRSSLRTHKFIPMIDTQHTRMKKDALSDEHASFSSQLIFLDRHHNSSRSLKVMRVKENTNSRKDVKSYPIGFEPSGLTDPAQHLVDYELIADRVYDIIENRLRIEKERE